VAHPKLGQHFLIKGAILERIAAAACPPMKSSSSKSVPAEAH